MTFHAGLAGFNFIGQLELFSRSLARSFRSSSKYKSKHHTLVEERAPFSPFSPFSPYINPSSLQPNSKLLNGVLPLKSLHRAFRKASNRYKMAGVMEPGVSSWKDHPQKYFGKVQIMLPWKSIQLLFPHRVRRRLRSKLRSRVSPASSISSLKTSFSPFDTLKSLQAHRWTVYDGQYLILIVLGVFSLCIIESPGPLAKTLVALGLLGSLLFPVTCQFFLPFLPIACWLIFFYACG